MLAFPPFKTSYDPQHTQNYRLFTVEESTFAIIDKPIQTISSLSLDLKGRRVIILAPIEAEGEITIEAELMIILAKVHSKASRVDLFATGKIVSLIPNPVRSHLPYRMKGLTTHILPDVPVQLTSKILHDFDTAIKHSKDSQMLEGVAACYEAFMTSTIVPSKMSDYLSTATASHAPDYGKIFGFFMIQTLNQEMHIEERSLQHIEVPAQTETLSPRSLSRVVLLLQQENTHLAHLLNEYTKEVDLLRQQVSGPVEESVEFRCLYEKYGRLGLWKNKS